MKQAQIALKMRDAETGEVVGENTAPATTEDGKTFSISPGYLPGLADAIPGDVRVEIQPAVVVAEFTGKTVTVDEETGNTILTLID